MVIAGARLRASAAENHADYRYEDYAEDGGRIHIRTHGVYFDTALKPWLTLRGNYVYDGISGATPTGAPPLPGENEVAKATIEDIRRAGYLETAIKSGRHTFTPQLSISRERDYDSKGMSFNHAMEFNEKNTTLQWGASWTVDRVLPRPGTLIEEPQNKDTYDLLLGVTQLLGPKTTFTLNLTLGYSKGYLSDPYKRTLFLDFPYFGGPYTVWPELRPSLKFRQVLYLSLQHYFESVNGAVEGDYRFHHDNFGIFAHTLGLQWHQKIGRRVVITPLFRYHTQTAARFYATQFHGDPSLAEPDPFVPFFEMPRYYSADYRLSALDSYTQGVAINVKLHEHVTIDLSYKRYIMLGRDGVTVSDQYPKANIFSGGMSIWF